MRIAIAVMALLLSGCPRRAATKQASEECKQLGQQCWVEPGKLGACAYNERAYGKADCTSGDCLSCQSQH
jgi:hypothetical protein